MKVSIRTAQFHSNVPLVQNGIDDLVTKIGAQLGAVEEVTDYGVRYDGIVLAKVVSCQKHDNADKLSVCRIDDGGVVQGVERGEDGLVQVVCGAPNVREGLYVAWIAPGATVPATFDKDPFKIEAREIRGVVSNGMLASASELAINDDHSGLLEVDIKGVSEDLAKPGTPFKELYGLDDTIIDIENKMFTHRPDCFGVLGVAREIAGIQGLAFESPDWYKNLPNFASATGLELEVDNQIPELVPRFMVVCMDNIEIKPSPVWMQALLTRIGVKPINNVVDITNYLSYLTAQPLHAYDYDKVAALSGGHANLVVRKPHDNEQIALLNGKTIKPRNDAIMIATDKELIGIGGVMGGTTTEVDASTKRIIIECANFDMYSIRKTSMAHGLFTDAVTRFNKGQSPLQNDRVLSEAMKIIQQYANGSQASSVIDVVDCDNVNISHDGWNDDEISLSAEFVNDRLGLSLKIEEITKILTNVEFGHDLEDQKIKLYSPFWRTDIAIPEDIVEEVGRLYGYEKLLADLPAKKITPAKVDKYLSLKSSLRNKLSAMGANEVLNYSFVNEKLIKDAGQNSDLAFKLTNALSPELQYYRLSIVPSLLARVHQNIKAGTDEFALYEIGKVHGKSEIDENKLPREFGRTALVVASKTNKTAAYYLARRYLDQLGRFTLVPFDQKLVGDHELLKAMTASFEPGRSALVVNPEGIPVGVVGEFKQSVIKAFKLPAYCAAFEVFLSVFKEFGNTNYVPLSQYPSISQDVCFEVPFDMSYQRLTSGLEEVLRDVAGELNNEYRLIDTFAVDGQPIVKRLTFRIILSSYERTLTEATVSSLTDSLAEKLLSSLGAKRI